MKREGDKSSPSTNPLGSESSPRSVRMAELESITHIDAILKLLNDLMLFHGKHDIFQLIELQPRYTTLILFLSLKINTPKLARSWMLSTSTSDFIQIPTVFNTIWAILLTLFDACQYELKMRGWIRYQFLPLLNNSSLNLQEKNFEMCPMLKRFLSV